MATASATTTHPEYATIQPALKSVRDCVLGGFFVKLEGYTYLPHPSQIDQTSPEAQQRYSEYKAGAEFDEITQMSLKSFLGRMKFSDTEFDLPDKLSYLVENADGDGVTMSGLIEQTAANVMQVGWHLLVAEYMNAPLPGEQMSQAQAASRGIRAAIKAYNRESVLDWDFRRINGVMQLSYLKVMEKRTQLDQITGGRDDVTEYLVMALDEEGSYYWQKFDDELVTQRDAPRNEVTVNGQRLKWLPVEIVADLEPPAGAMPKSMGLLSPIATACLDRYRVSADYKETIKNICPTSYTAGWTEQGWEQFQLMNQGRDYIAFGARAMNNLPLGVEMDTLNPSITLEGFERYFEANKQKIIGLGGVWPSADGSATKTATQSENESSEVTSRLVTLANSLEASFRRVVAYCGLFEGMWAQDAIEQQLESIVIDLPTEFARSKLTPQEQREIRDNYLAGLYSRNEAVRLLVRGGCTVSDVDTILAESEDMASGLTSGE